MANYPPMSFGYPQQYQAQYQPRPQLQPMQTPPPAAQPNNAMQYVTSKNEVLSCQIPFDGSTAYFFDTSSGKIYAKAFDPNTGTAPILTYAPEMEKQVTYATIDDLNAVVGEINSLKKAIGALSVPPAEQPKRKVKKDDADEQ